MQRNFHPGTDWLRAIIEGATRTIHARRPQDSLTVGEFSFFCDALARGFDNDNSPTSKPLLSHSVKLCVTMWSNSERGAQSRVSRSRWSCRTWLDGGSSMHVRFQLCTQSRLFVAKFSTFKLVWFILNNNCFFFNSEQLHQDVVFQYCCHCESYF